MIDRDSLPYRPCVGVLLFNAEGRVFVGRRIDTPDAWQMQQGGIDDGETPEVAALRELGEEIGTSNAAIESATAGWLTYDLPDDLIGKVWRGRWRGRRHRRHVGHVPAGHGARTADGAGRGGGGEAGGGGEHERGTVAIAGQRIHSK